MSCHYWVASKRRYCTFAVGKDALYCPIHNTGSGDKLRIPCPLDPRHSIYEKDTESHLLKCSLAVQRFFEAHQPCSKARCNVANDSTSYSTDEPTLFDVTEWAQYLVPIRTGLLAQLGDVKYDESAPFVPPAWSPIVERCAQRVTGKSVSDLDKHNYQNAALLMTLSVPPGGVLFAELGCGKAGLTLWLMEAVNDDQHTYVLLDCEARRNKQENKSSDRRASVVRFRLDIRDFDLAQFLTADSAIVDCYTGAKQGSIEWRISELHAKVSALRSRQSWPPTHVIGVAKHLCGAATDWGLRCLVQSGHPSVSVLFATCCHHRCVWEELVGRESLSQLGLTKERFAQMLGMAGWATTQDVSEEKRIVGRLVKSIIDLSRLVWLQQSNLTNATFEYRKYIEASITPENFVIVVKQNV